MTFWELDPRERQARYDANHEVRMSWNQTEIIANEEEGTPHQEQNVEQARLEPITEHEIDEEAEGAPSTDGSFVSCCTTALADGKPSQAEVNPGQAA